MRLLYLVYPKCQTLSGKLSWSHYIELLALSDELARSFYEQQCIRENWTVRELKRQKETALFERVALSNQLFVSRYQLHLPDTELLKRELKRILEGN